MGIKTEKLSVGYGNKIVVDNVNLEVLPGRILTLIGPNGSGKSTILKSITRQIKALGGAIYLDDSDMKDMSENQIARSLAMVLTERPRTELMTCRDLVATGRFPYTGRLGILQKEDWEKVDQAIAMVRAEEVANQDFTRVSDGQKQRIMLARVICQDTGIILLDEPTSYLDMRFKLDILSNIRKLARDKNIAVIMSLHELDLAQKISDTVACVDGSHISRVGRPEEVFTGDFIQKLYGVEPECFDPVTGGMNLPSRKGRPEVFVIGGGGSGIPLYYALQRDNISFAAGILAENDIEYQTAKALASQVVSSKAFHPIEDGQIDKAREYIDSCSRCISRLTEFGPLNEANRKLIEYAESIGKLEK